MWRVLKRAKKSQDFFDALEKNALQLQCVLLAYVFIVFVIARSDFSLLPSYAKAAMTT